MENSNRGVDTVADAIEVVERLLDGKNPIPFSFEGCSGTLTRISDEEYKLVTEYISPKKGTVVINFSVMGAITGEFYFDGMKTNLGSSESFDFLKETLERMDQVQ